MASASDIILILVAIILPPASVLFMSGCSCDLLINICLTVLGYIPGHIHAFWLIYKKSKAEAEYGLGNVSYHGNGEYRPKYGGGVAQPPIGTHRYGAVDSA